VRPIVVDSGSAALSTLGVVIEALGPVGEGSEFIVAVSAALTTLDKAAAALGLLDAGIETTLGGSSSAILPLRFCT
jgi:hypothetical protein